MTPNTETQQRAWMAQWRAAAVALEQIRAQELAAADLEHIASALDDACLAAARLAARSVSSGLVEQQRLLHRCRAT